MRRLFGQIAAVHGGYIAEYVGDGVVMYFGYPQAQEDDPERAIRCGLAIGRQVESVHSTMGLDTPLSVRTGIHTSHAALGPLTLEDNRQWAAYGIATSIAARLQKEALPGGVVVTDATWNLVQDHFSGRSLGPLSLTGLSQRIVAWRIDGETPANERDDLPHTAALFVGRERERGVLEDLWRGAQDGETHFALLRGEPGMGKSRLTRYWRDTVAQTSATVVMARATPDRRNHPFHPIVTLLERSVGLRSGRGGDDRLGTLARGLRKLGVDDAVAVPLIAPLVDVQLDERYETPNLSSARRRGRSIEILTEILLRLCSKGPTLLVFEDLHWADESTAELLEHVVATLPSVGLLGLLTARPDFDEGWGGGTRLQTVTLDRLNWVESEAIARSVARGKALPEQALRQILTRSEGVPLFIEELTRSVIESGTLRERQASWEIVEPPWKDLIPMAVHAPLIARIDRLGPARPTAQLAATIGREFSFALLREVSGRDEATLRRDLRRLEEAGLAWESGESGPDMFVFKHALIRDAAYEMLPRATRQAYHSRIAGALRRPPSGPAAGRNDLIALHLTNAGEHDDAVAFWEAAGHDSLQRTANLEASGHFRRALDCLAQLPATTEHKRRELELQNVIAPVLFSIYGWGSVEAEQACLRARDLAVELGRTDRLYQALWGLWSAYFLRGQLEPAMQAAETLHEMAQASGDLLFEITGWHATAYTRLFRGEFDSTLHDADAGLALLDFEREKELVKTFQLSSGVCLLLSRAEALWMLGRVAEADQAAEQMLQLARDLDHPASLAAALAFTLHGGTVRHSYTGQMARLRDTATELHRLSHEEGFYLWCAVSEIYLGVIGQALGERNARGRMREGLELFAQTRTRVTAVLMNVMVAEALYDIGDDDEALRLLDEAETEARESAKGFFAPEIWRVRARFLARQGKPSEAESAYRRALELAASQKAHSLELRAALDLHDLLDAQDRAADGHACLAEVFGSRQWATDRPDPARARTVLARSTLRPTTGASHGG